MYSPGGQKREWLKERNQKERWITDATWMVIDDRKIYQARKVAATLTKEHHTSVHSFIISTNVG